MNRILFCLVLVAMAVLVAFKMRAQPSNPPASVTLAWTPSSSPGSNVAGYWIWQGLQSSNYVRTFFVTGSTSGSVTIPVDRGVTHYWNITALGSNAAAGLESPYDGEASTNLAAPPLAPTGLRILPLTP